VPRPTVVVQLTAIPAIPKPTKAPENGNGLVKEYPILGGKMQVFNSPQSNLGKSTGFLTVGKCSNDFTQNENLTQLDYPLDQAREIALNKVPGGTIYYMYPIYSDGVKGGFLCIVPPVPK
jgi:hypothetical protein